MSSSYSIVFWVPLYFEMENIDNTCIAEEGLLSLDKNVSNSPSWEYKYFTCVQNLSKDSVKSKHVTR